MCIRDRGVTPPDEGDHDTGSVDVYSEWISEDEAISRSLDADLWRRVPEAATAVSRLWGSSEFRV